MADDAELEREKQERADAEERASRANERAQQADEAYRKLQLELVTAKDEAAAAREEVKHLQEKVSTFEADLAKLRESSEAAITAANAAALALRSSIAPASSMSPPPRSSQSPPTKPSEKPPAKGPTIPPLVPPPHIVEMAIATSNAQVEAMLARIEGLRELLATASIELSQLNADEVALATRRTRVLTDACALLARAVGATGQAPPPIPSKSLEARLSIAPVVDISEVADLIDSLRPKAE